MDNFSRSASGGVNLSRLSVGMDLNEPASSKWSSTTSIKFEVPYYFFHYEHPSVFIFFYNFFPDFNLICAMQHVRPLNDNGQSMSRDLDGFPVTCR